MNSDYAILDSLIDGIILVDASGVVRHANRSAAGLLTRPHASIAGQNVVDLFDGLDAARWADCCRRANVSPFISENMTLRGQTGSRMLLIISAVQEREGLYGIQFREADNDGQQLSMEIKFLTLFENSTDGLALFEKPEDPAKEPTLIMCNDTYVRMTGRSRRELMALRISDLIEPLNVSPAHLTGWNVGDFDMIYSWHRPDGHENFIASRSVTVELGEKKYEYSINHEVTVQRHIEDMFRSEHCAVENAGTGIVILDNNLVITYLNPATVHMLRYEYTGELLGSAAIRLWSDPVEGQALLQTALETGESVHVETRMLCSDNTTLEIELSIALNYDSDSVLKGLVLSLLDISDRKKAEQHHAMIASLGAACHHLGQPAQILMATLSMMKMDYTGDPELITVCEEAVERIGDILRKLGAVTEFKTVPYAQGSSSRRKDVILDI